MKNQALVDKIAQAVLYEGYILYPYRPSVKNRQRWTFGGLCPRAYSEAQQGSEPWSMQTQCLVHAAARLVLEVRVRFLHLQPRTVGALDQPLNALPAHGEPEYKVVPSLQVGDTRYQTWEEAVECEVAPSTVALDELAERPLRHDFTLPAHYEMEPLHDANASVIGVLIRQRHAIEGCIEVAAEPVDDKLYRVTVGVFNRTPWQAATEAQSNVTRDDAMRRSLASTHILLGIPDAQGAGFVSLIDPPESCREAAAACRNVGCWPVLVGEQGETDTMLASPIILYDYPQIAPESPGDLFDATEIDEMLTLRILTLTDEEKQSMAAVDERARALLERTRALGQDEMMQLHGALRDSNASASLANDESAEPDVTTAETAFKVGDRVRLRPHRCADAFDIALNGQVATIVAIEQDYEERIHLAVTVDDDPGKDFGEQGKPAHRFFFAADEVEPLPPDARSPA